MIYTKSQLIHCELVGLIFLFNEYPCLKEIPLDSYSMDRGDKLKVYFKMNEGYYGLFNIIQMGANGIVDLKITNYYNNLAIVIIILFYLRVCYFLPNTI